MIALSIDTASSICAVGVSDLQSGQVLSSTSEDIGRGHAEILMGRIDICLEQSGHTFRDIKRVIATTGPGSFTGVRVGLSCARAIALALAVPVIGVSNLQACASYAAKLSGNTKSSIGVLLDARRDEIYFQRFANGNEFDLPKIISFDDISTDHGQILSGVEMICGDGVGKLEKLLESLGERKEFEIPHLMSSAPIEIISALGRRATPAKSRPVPLYLRKPDAKPQNDFAVPRLISQQADT
jgi:tRNA threonylcarbamoyl adenosine modification protein YeaZ